MIIKCWVLLAVLAIPVMAEAQWTGVRGGPSRQGARAGNAQLDTPQETWRMGLGGSLSSQSTWILDTLDPAILVAAGGRITAKAWDDVPKWQSPLLQANQILAVVDVDQDGVTDTIIANRNGVAGTLTLLDMDGTIRWTAPTEMGRLINGVRIEDLDGDGLLDILLTPYRGGITALSLSPTEAPSILWENDRANRDYKAGFFDLIGEFDGNPGLDLISAGHRRLYLHSAATGELRQTSPQLEVIPYSRATMVSLDIDNDGVEEVVAFSNQAWAAPQNRRHVSVYSWNNANFSQLWSYSLNDPENDRLAFTQQSIGDFDADGIYEIVVSIYDNQTSTWRIEIYDAKTGEVLNSLPGHRLSDIVSFEKTSYIATKDDGPLRLLQFRRGSQLTIQFEDSDLEIARCREQQDTVRSAPTVTPCILSDQQLVLFSRDENQRVTTLSLMNSSLVKLPQTYTSNSGSIVGVWKIPNSNSATVAVALSTGEIHPLTTELLVPPPLLSPPYSWSGLYFGNTSFTSNYPRFPLSFFSEVEPLAENLLVFRANREAVAIAPSKAATVTGGVKEIWSHNQVDQICLASNLDTPRALLFDTQDGVTAVSLAAGDELWTTPNLLNHGDQLYLHHAPLHVDQQTWFHRRNSNSGTYDLVSLSNETGDLDFVSSLESNNSGWRRLSKVTGPNGESSAASGRNREIWTYDADGIPTTQFIGDRGATMIIDIADGWLQLGTSLERIEYNGDISWSIPLNNAPLHLGAVLPVNTSQIYTTIIGNTNELVAIDTTTGTVIWNTLLNDGSISEVQTKGKTVFGNVTGITSLSPSIGPAFLVGGSDGYLYAVEAESGTLIWSMNLGSRVGEIVPTDWDGDGFLELAVVTEDGNVRGIDTFRVAIPSFCFDLDPQDVATIQDVDRIDSRSQLAAAWGEVPDAIGYEIAVYSAGGELIRDFTDVGRVTQATISELPLVSGQRYRIAVRALAADSQHSADIASNGVTVVFDSNVDDSTDDLEPGQNTGGCGCGVDSSSSNRNTAIFLVLVLCSFAIRRKNRKGAAR